MSLIIDPASLSPSGWYRAQDISGIDGTAVGTWPDASGNGRDLTQGTAANKPVMFLRGRNGKKFVRFDGTNDSLASSVNASVFLGAEGIGTVLAIFVEPSGTRGYHPIWTINNGTDVITTELTYDTTAVGGSTEAPWPRLVAGVYVSLSGGFFDEDKASVRIPRKVQGDVVASTNPQEIVNGWHVACWVHDKISGTHYVRGGIDNLDAAALVSNVADIDADLAKIILLGRNATSARFFRGDLYEVIIYPTVLTEAQRRGVQLYLTNRFALSYHSGIAEEGSATVPYRVEMKLPSTAMTVSPGPTLWLRADDLALANNDPVGTWVNQGLAGTAANVMQATTGKKPLYKTNQTPSGKPAVLFDGADDILASSALLSAILGSSGRGTIIAFVNWTLVGSLHHHPVLAAVGAGGFTKLELFETAVPEYLTQATNYDGSEDVSTQIGLPGGWATVLWAHDLFASKVYAGADSPADSQLAAVGIATGGTTDLYGQAFGVGGKDSASFYFKGYIAEVLVFDRFLNEDERCNVHAYLAAKYGTTYALVSLGDPPRRWMDVTGDVRSTGDVSTVHGITGTAFSDKIADSGALELTLRNDAKNSAGLIGYYSPGHANARAGFGLGVLVRTAFDYYGTTYYKWLGRLTDIKPAPGEDDYGVRVIAADYIDELARTKIPRLAVQTNASADDILKLILAAMPRQPQAQDIGECSDVYPFSLDDVQEEGSLALTSVKDLVLSELGYLYPRGNEIDGGELVLEPRGQRNIYPVVHWAIDSQLRDLDPVHTADDVLNRAVVTVHPRRIDSAATAILFSLGASLEIPRNTTQTFDCPYRDPANGRYVRVGGTSMVTPVATTDYLFNALADGTGTVLTTQLSVSVSFGGNSATATVTNNGPYDGFLTLFHLRGKGVYSYEAVVASVRDTTSVGMYGENAETVDMPYQSDANLALDAASFIVAKGKDPRTRISNVTFLVAGSSIKAMNALAREIGDRISVTEDTSGLVADEYFIQQIAMRMDSEHKIWVRWLLAPADGTDYWLLGITNRSQLDVSTILGYGSQ